ncbi:MAG: PLP-dependent aminotransferase family protein [Rhizobiaceae bacterium]
MTDPDRIAYARSFASKLPPAKVREEVNRKYNFGTGHNDPDAIPVESFAEAARNVLRREGRNLAIYGLGGSALGYKDLREVVADKLRRHRGIDIGIDNVLITSGSLQGMDLINSLLLDGGDTVIIEQFTYVAALSKAKWLGVEAVPAPLDDGGIDMDGLAAQLERLKLAGKRAKYIYTIPTIQNPTGSILSLERRHRLIELARHYQTPIFEDECYADLIWAGEAPPALYGLAPDQVIHIGSFSKTLAPALRLGYLLAPWDALGQILAFKSDGGTGALDQMVAAEYFRDHFDSHVATLTRMLKRKLDVLVGSDRPRIWHCGQCAGAARGSLCVGPLPKSVDARKLSEQAAKADIAINAGPDWAVEPEDGAHSIRLCFGLVTESEINEGIAELARVCHENFGVPEHSANRPNRGAA